MFCPAKHGQYFKHPVINRADMRAKTLSDAKISPKIINYRQKMAGIFIILFSGLDNTIGLFFPRDYSYR